MNMMVIIFPHLVALVHAAILFSFLANISMATLPPSEVEALREIAKTVGKMDWNFSVDPCSGEYGWKTENPKRGAENVLTCRCPNDTDAKPSSCHVISIRVKEQSLSGTLPPALDGLPFLQELDLTRNIVNGTIPRGWSSSKLVNISLGGNRLTGQLPKELGNISTLVNLIVEFNQLSGPVPREIGNLIGLQKLRLTSNYFTGELPDILAKLTALKDFWMGDNNFIGKIPDFIQSWTNLEKLYIHGSGLVGPIPPSISYLTKLTDLRISDLDGAQQPFPDLSKMGNLRILVLRGCNINGSLPDYLGTRITLKTL